jgi:uncharacterized protein
VIAVDTNILVYAHRIDMPWHGAAKSLLSGLVSGRGLWALPWPCIHEFLGIVTHPKIFRVPTPMDLALEQVMTWSTSPSAASIGESGTHMVTLASIAKAARLTGPRIHDAKIAAICLDHGVSELWTADRDFSLFPALRTRNPLVS